MEDQRQEDVDMMSLIKSFRNMVSNFFKSILWLIDFSIRNTMTLLVFILVFFLLSLGLYFISKPYYKSLMSVSHTRLNNDNCAALISSLNSGINLKVENKTLADILNIGVKTAREVKSIQYKMLNEKLSKRYEDSTTVRIPFWVEVEVYNNNVLDTLETAIINFLESNAYASVRKEIEKQALVRIEEKIDEELMEMDSLKQILNQSIIPRSQGNGIILGEPIDPVTVYRRSMELYEKKMDLIRRSRLINSFEVLVSFSKSEKKASAGKLFYVAVGMIVGYIAGLSYLFNKRRNSGRKERVTGG